MLDKSKRYLIVGLGLLGGKYALELTRAGYTVDGINRSEGHLQFALDHGYIRSGKTHDFEDLVQSADHIIFALYPTAMIEWFKTYGSLLKPGCIFTDVSGVKTGLVEPIQALCPDGVEFIASHPMAGRETSSVEHAAEVNFAPANFIITPTEKNTPEAVQWAREHGAAPAVFTFKLPADSKMKGRRLLSTEDKHALIASLGVEYYLCPEFEEIRAMTPEQFVYGIVQDCHAKALFCGENFTFGAKAAGTPELLKELCAPLGVEVVVVPMAQFEEKPVSSTRIRTALEGGDVPAANAMLGMPYAIRFAVQHGAGLGRTLGVPTINQIYPAGFQMPRYGIYITRTRIGDTWYPSATGLGTRPTVNSDETKVTCETFIPDFSGDLYGTDPVVEFYAYLSPSKKFDTLDELKACIDHAARRAKAYFAKA